MKRLGWGTLAMAAMLGASCGGRAVEGSRLDDTASPDGSEPAPGETDTTVSPGDSPSSTGGGGSTGSTGSTGTAGNPVSGGAVTGTGTAGGTTTITTGTAGTVGGAVLGTGGMVVSPPPVAVGGGVFVGFGGGVMVGGGGSSLADAPAAVDCETAAEFSEPSYCQLDLSCQNDYISTYCYDQGSSTWRCDCGSSYGAVSFELSGADSSTACAIVSEVCSTREGLDFPDEESCVVEYQSTSGNYCDLQERCSRRVQVAEGVDAVLDRWRYANCYDDGTGRLICQCGDDMTNATYSLAGTTGMASCELALDLCGGQADVTFEGPPTCTTSYQNVSQGYCDIQQECTESAAISDGVTALKYDSRWGSCQELEAGTASCTCQSEQRSLRMDLDMSVADSGACTRALDVCASQDELVLSGSVACERAYQSASAGYCDTQLTCSQSATLGSLAMVVHGDLFASCQQTASDAPWTCSCGSGQESTRFELEAAAGWDVCSTAAERCPELVEVQFDSAGYWGGIPIPL